MQMTEAKPHSSMTDSRLHTMELTLTDPLLSDNNNSGKMSPTDWPTKEAERAKLLIPAGYDPYQGEVPGKCYLKFDGERKLFLLVSDASGETLDIIDPNDVIGAAVEVELFGAADELRSTTFRNNEQQEKTEGPSSPAEDCGIFKPLGENADKIFSICNNEPASDIPFDTQAAAVLTLYVYPRIDPSTKGSIFASCGLASNNPKPVKDYKPPADVSKLGSRHAHHRRFQVAPAEDFSDISTVVRSIRKICRPSPQTDRLLVVINPFSGMKLGEEVYKTVLAPMLEHAGIDHDHIVTTHARHAEQLMKEHPKDSGITDLSEYDAIVAIGGDGMVHEIFQGIRHRSDCQEILKRLKLGHVGAGTSNGLPKSLAHASKVSLGRLTLMPLLSK
jgi:sphingosine kinase